MSNRAISCSVVSAGVVGIAAQNADLSSRSISGASRRWPSSWKPFTLEKHSEVELELGGHYQFAVIEPLLVSLNGEDLVLGYVEKKAPSALVDSVDGDRVRLAPHLNDIAYSDFLPEMPSAPAGKQAVRYRPAVHPGEAPGHDQPA